jgi:glycosyltransferase involved in cell wall biosynthesis
MPLLSILVPTLVTRQQFMAKLLAQLKPQLTPEVELLVQLDNGEESIGGKRNTLLERATSQYTAFADDDDELAPDYVSSILEAIKSKPDVVTFNMVRYIDGIQTGYQQMRLHNTYEIIDAPIKQYHYPPTHLCPIRREISQTILFPCSNAGEDTFWQDAIRPHFKTEVHIDAVLYRYLYRTSKPNELTNAQVAGDSEVEKAIDEEMTRLINLQDQCT